MLQKVDMEKEENINIKVSMITIFILILIPTIIFISPGILFICNTFLNATKILFIVLFILLTEILQILLSKSKIRRWILPILFFLCSLSIILAFWIQDNSHLTNYGVTFIFVILEIFLFIVTNIPTVIFVVTNIILKDRNELKENTKKYFKFSILIILVVLVVLLF